MYSTRNIPTFDYASLSAFLNGKQQRKICNLTYAINTGDSLQIQYESGDYHYHCNGGERNTIAEFTPDGKATYTDAGWQTATTKQRLNQILPEGSIYQKDFEWYFETGEITAKLMTHDKLLFQDGKFVRVYQLDF